MARRKTKKTSKVRAHKATKTRKKRASPIDDTSSMETAMSSSGTGKRLTPEQRQAIATAEGSLKEIAERFDTSINTVARYRKNAGVSGRSAGRTRASNVGGRASTGGMQVTAEGDYIVLRIPKSGLMKQMLGSMFD